MPHGGARGRWKQVAKQRPDVAVLEVEAPTQVFDEPLGLNGGGQRSELLHPGLRHTQGDAVAWLPDERVLFTGDPVSNEPFDIVRDAEMGPWVETITSLQAREPWIACPNRGPRGDAGTGQARLRSDGSHPMNEGDAS